VIEAVMTRSSSAALKGGLVRFREGAGLWWPLDGLTPLRVRGEDRLTFVHGQLSNEVQRLALGGASQALMLNHKGHALAEVRVYRREDDLYLAVEGGKGLQVKTQLEAHIIFDQVTLQDLSGEIVGLSVQGERAAAILWDVLAIEVPQAGAFVQVPFASAEVLVAPVKRSAVGGVDIHVLRRDAEALGEALAAAGALRVDQEMAELLRVEAGIAAAHREGGEGVLPQECGLEHAVSYTKGCYLGQEIMARIEARGSVRRTLQGVRLAAFPEERDVTVDDKVVGRLGTVVEHPELGVIALAVVRRDLATPRVRVGEVEGEITALPFV
jgi:folate-binding protein YgfZ